MRKWTFRVHARASLRDIVILRRGEDVDVVVRIACGCAAIRSISRVP